MPITVLIVEKSGTIKELNLKSFDENELYKKAGFKNAEGFKLQTEWGVTQENKSFNICVYGKTNGRAGQENKYEFPPPIDTTLFFGSCILVNIDKTTREAKSLTANEWEMAYEYLYGGFEDMGSHDSSEECDMTDEDDHLPKTKQGYAKDGFIVDDSNDDSDEYITEEEVVVTPKTKKTRGKKSITKTKTKQPDVDETTEPTSYLDCTSELEEEEYI